MSFFCIPCDSVGKFGSIRSSDVIPISYIVLNK